MALYWTDVPLRSIAASELDRYSILPSISTLICRGIHADS